MIGTYLSPKYMDLEERPRSTYIRGTGILLGFLELGGLGILVILPLFFYYFWKDVALGIGMTSTLAILLSIVIALVFIALFYRLASRSMQRVSLD
jgi:membrane protein implicated in regulation of membrane protease activity